LRPRLVGLGYEFQKTSRIKAYNWDQPLNNAVTEKRIYAF
jgi:5-formyltetrahydrofolate cyclo-ligase